MQNWLKSTESKLRSAPRHLTLTRIARETGLKISWLSDFAKGKIEDPGIRKVQTLFEYLSIEPPPLGERNLYEDVMRMSAAKQPRRQCVYAVYEGEVLLYVGVTDQPIMRLKAHDCNGKFNSHTPSHVELFFFEGDDGKEKSQAYERQCINTLNPLLNHKRVSG